MNEEKEKLRALRLKEKFLLIEIKAVQQQIALYEEILNAATVNSVQEDENLETESIPLQTARGKEKSSPLNPDALGKSMKAKDEPQSSSSPVANGSGKDSTNPLMAGNLPKITKLSYAQQLLAPDTNQKHRFYVIFDGDHRGIYEDWSIVSKYVQHTSVPFKKFGSFMQAQQEATRYSAEFGKKEIPMKMTVFTLPKVKTTKPSPVVFTKTPSFEKRMEVQQEEIDLVSLDEFRSVWSKARALGPEDFEAENIYTEDKTTKSLYIFCPGADTTMVSLAFSAGLTKYIYPSANLQEIGNFSEGIKKAIKTFRKKIAAAKDANIFIKCTSALPDWQQGKSFPAMHVMEIGLAKTRNAHPSKVMEEHDDISQWVNIRVNGYLKILEILQQTTIGSFKKVNYCGQNCIIISYSGTPLPAHEKRAIETMEDQIIFNNVDVGPSTKKALCKELLRKIERHVCDECRQKEDSTIEIMEEDTRELDPTHGFID